MQIERVATQAEFQAHCGWATLRQFGSFADLPRDAAEATEMETDEDIAVLVAVVDGVAAGYVNADIHGVWNIEVQPAYRGQGIARALVVASGADYFCEVCSDEGAALAEALGLDYEDCR